MKNVELNKEQLTMIRTALGLLENEALQRFEGNGVDCFTKSEEEKYSYFYKVVKLYNLIRELEEELLFEEE